MAKPNIFRNLDAPEVGLQEPSSNRVGPPLLTSVPSVGRNTARHDPIYDPSDDQARTTIPQALVAVIRDSVVDQILAILDAPRPPGEPTSGGFRRKEHELASVFATLTIAESHALHARLSNPRTGDNLAAKFSRLLVADRKRRLLTFIGDARRRAALAGR